MAGRVFVSKVPGVTRATAVLKLGVKLGYPPTRSLDLIERTQMWAKEMPGGIILTAGLVVSANRATVR